MSEAKDNLTVYGDTDAMEGILDKMVETLSLERRALRSGDLEQLERSLEQKQKVVVELELALSQSSDVDSDSAALGEKVHELIKLNDTVGAHINRLSTFTQNSLVTILEASRGGGFHTYGKSGKLVLK